MWTVTRAQYFALISPCLQESEKELILNAPRERSTVLDAQGFRLKTFGRVQGYKLRFSVISYYVLQNITCYA